MPEHDDDLESTVREDAEEEADTYPRTADELDEAQETDEDGVDDIDEGSKLPLDPDESEL